MPLSAGDKLGPYEIVAPLGAGGMGEVFRGVDTRLGRPVAIKLAHRQFSDRFEREAKAISALNHPHICTLYDVDATQSGSSYLVMELVEGDTLAARLRKSDLPMEQVLRYGAEIADALAAAHAKGITHRDLKPGNIMLARSGVKVLDFGLARSTEDDTLAKRVMPVESRVSFVPGNAGGPGALFYYREGVLVARRFDPDQGVVSEPDTVIDGVDYAPASIEAFFRVSADGSAVVIGPAGSLNDQLAWFNRDGGQAGTLGSPGDIDQPRLSPDGSRVAFTRPDAQSGNRDVWSLEIVRGILTRLSLNAANDWFPVWSSDGKQLLFGSDRGGKTEIAPFRCRWNRSVKNPRFREPTPLLTGRTMVNGSPWGAKTFGLRQPLATERRSNSWPLPSAKGTRVFRPMGNGSRILPMRVAAPKFMCVPSTVDLHRRKVRFKSPVKAATTRCGGLPGRSCSSWRRIQISTPRICGIRGAPEACLFRPAFFAHADTEPSSKTGVGYEYNFDTRDGRRFLVNCFVRPAGRFIVLLNWAGLKQRGAMPCDFGLHFVNLVFWRSGARNGALDVSTCEARAVRCTSHRRIYCK